MPVGFQAGLRLVDWVLSGASVDLDFVNNRYFGSSGSSVASYLSITRASVGNAKNSSGVWVSFSANTLRITDSGLLIEDARTNNLLQSETPATQTTASLATGSYTLWVEGSGSALASGGSATITGAASATAGSPDTFSVTVAGTVVVTVTGSLTRFQLENGSFASSYIPTTGTTATRAADAVTGIGSFSTAISGSAGSALARTAPMPSPSATNSIILARDGSASGGYGGLFETAGNTQVLLSNNTTGDLRADLGNSLTFTTSRIKSAFCWDGSGRGAVGAGGSVTSDANSVGSSGTPWLGAFDQSGFAINTYLERVTLWTTRLADATLQALTAP